MEKSDARNTAYVEPSWFYDIRGFFILTFAYQDTLWSQISFFSRWMRHVHLEVAVGSGTLLYFTLLWRKLTKKEVPTIHALDNAPRMLEGAKLRFKKNSNVHVALGDVTHLPFHNGMFDSVHIANSLHCISHVEPALHEMNRVLKSGGIFACNVLLYPSGITPMRKIAHLINQWGMQKGILYTPYSREEIESKIRVAGFQITHSTRKGNALYVCAKRL